MAVDLSPQIDQVYNSQLQILQTDPELKNDVSDYMLIDLKSEAASCNRYKILYEVASVTSLVFFTAISIGGLVVCTIFAPEYTPFVMIGIGTGLLPLFKKYVFDPLKKKADQYQIISNNVNNILAKIDHFNEAGETDIYREIFAIGAQAPSSASITNCLAKIDPEMPVRSLVPIIARYRHWEETASKVEELAQQTFDEVHNKMAELQQEQSETRKQKIQSQIQVLQGRHYKLQEAEYLPSKIRAAFMIYLLSHIDQKVGPEQKKVNMSDFGKENALDYLDRALAREWENANNYFIMKNGDGISRDWLLSASISDISQRIFREENVMQTA
ncbi:MAG: hypothetical protein Tsb0015_08550 [Simkaniaceae bacterium]